MRGAAAAPEDERRDAEADRELRRAEAEEAHGDVSARAATVVFRVAVGAGGGGRARGPARIGAATHRLGRATGARDRTNCCGATLRARAPTGARLGLATKAAADAARRMIRASTAIINRCSRLKINSAPILALHHSFKRKQIHLTRLKRPDASRPSSRVTCTVSRR